MTSPAILLSAATAGAAGAVAVGCLILTQARLRPAGLRWFALAAGLNAVFAAMHVLRNGATDLAVVEVVLRVNSAVAPLFAIAVLGVYRHLAGAACSRLDRWLIGALAASACYGALSPGGYYLARLESLGQIDIAWLGHITVPQGTPDPLLPLIWSFYFVALARTAALAFRAGRQRPLLDVVILASVPCALLVTVTHGLGLARGWWGGIPLGEYFMTAIFLALGLELARRERSLLAELHDREAKLSALVEHGLGFGGLLDPAGRLVLANRTSLRAIGAEAGEVVGRPFAETPWWTHRPADQLRLRAAIARAAAGEPDRFLATHRLADGRVADIDFSLTPFRDRNGSLRYLIAEGRDVSELRRYEERLREGGKFEAIGQLAGGIAHDFNNVLAGIIGAAELAMKDAAPTTQRRMQTILSAAGKAADLTRKLLSFSRRGKVQDVALPLNALIVETLDLLRRGAGPALAVECDLAASPDLTCGDPAELQAALLNLFVNARDAMEGGGTLAVTSRNATLDPAACAGFAQAVQPGDYLVVEVADTGCGMDPAVQARMFEPFFTTKDPGKGTGLGMPAVLGIVLAHHGALTVDSRPGAGTRVSLWLPASSRPVAAAPVAMGRDRGAGLIVLVEDEALIRLNAVDMLELIGFRVEAFADPRQARERLRRSGDVRCVILDLAMPHLDGRTLYRELRSANPTVPVVISSGYAGGDQMVDAAGDGNLRFLPKPWREQQLRQVFGELGVLAPAS